MVEHGERAALRGEGVRALPEKVPRPLREAARRVRAPDVHVRAERVLVILASPREQRGRQRDAHAAAEVTDDVVGGGCVAEVLHANGRQRQRLQRHEDEALAEALNEARQRQGPVVHAEGDVGHEDERDGVQRAAEAEERALVHPRHQAPRDEERQHVADTARRQHQSRGPGVVAHQLLRVEGEQDGARVEAEAHRDHDHGSDREVAVVEDGEVQDRLLRGELPDQEAGDGADGDHGEPDDERGIEPVGPLPLIEHELERAESHHHEREPRPVHRRGLAHVR